jgi:hypothetical protein
MGTATPESTTQTRPKLSGCSKGREARQAPANHLGRNEGVVIRYRVRPIELTRLTHGPGSGSQPRQTHFFTRHVVRSNADRSTKITTPISTAFLSSAGFRGPHPDINNRSRPKGKQPESGSKFINACSETTAV